MLINEFETWTASQNLVDFVERVKEKYWSDWEEEQAKDPPPKEDKKEKDESDGKDKKEDEDNKDKDKDKDGEKKDKEDGKEEEEKKQKLGSLITKEAFHGVQKGIA